MKYTVDYFLKKFKTIPSKEWGRGYLFDYKKRCCALEHCNTKERNRFLKILSGSEIIFINDGISKKYKQKTPKARILAALRDKQL